MKKRDRTRKKSAVSGIISAAILFTILFSTGTSYFLYVIYLNQQQQIATSVRTQTDLLQKSEQFQVFGKRVRNNVGFWLNNTGGVTIRIMNIFLSNTTGYFKFISSSTAGVNPSLPITVNVGGSLSSFDTGVAASTSCVTTQVPTSTCNYTFKVLTERGNVGVGYYPNIPVPVATLGLTAIIAQGAGFLALDFNTYRAYNTTGAAPGCNPSSPGCQLTPWPGGSPAYTLRSAFSTNRYYVFSANVTNVDPSKRNITLDTDTTLVQFLVPKAGTGGGTSRSWGWSIGSVSSSGVTQSSSPITMIYGQTVTLFFTNIPGNIQGTQWPASGDFTAVFIYLHGTIGSSSYGQNIPFVTTKYT